MDKTQYVVEMENITRTFPGIVACDDITLRLIKGEIHALLGENGAGKSTLMSVLFGMYLPNSGTIKINGETVNINSPREANQLGIGMVHQHFKLVHNFTVLQNIILGAETVRGGFLKMGDAREKVVALSEQYGLAINPDALISDITVAMQQRVEILKMLYRDNDILIFDEPTAVLTPQEIEELMTIMKNLAAEGKTLVFISHKLNEIKQAADRVTILRHGKLIDTLDVSKTNKEEMSEMMVGRKINFTVIKDDPQLGDTVLSVKNLTIRNKDTGKNVVNDVSFDVRKGEIVCLAGIDGNGQSELVYGITGLMPLQAGSVALNGEDITTANVRKRNVGGMAHIPEDRHKYGLILDYTLAENMVLKNYFKQPFQKGGFLDFNKMNSYTDELIERFDVRVAQGGGTLARSMSGGNQQKAIVARETDQNPDLLVAVQPTRGLDVGAIEYIHQQLVAQRDAGKAVLLMSLELDEVMDISDRILVIFEGEIVADLNPKKTTVQEMGLYMAGTKREERA